MKKMTKLQAFELIKRAIDNNEGLEGATLKDLLTFFAPPLPKVAKTAEQWVCKAAGKNDVREWVNYLYAHDGWLYATDGHRAHRVRTNLTNGYYDPLTMHPADHIRCENPLVRNVNSFFPSIFKGMQPVTVSSAEEVQVSSKLSRYEWCGESHAFDKKYVTAAINHEDSTPLYIRDDRLHGVSSFGEFIIMGLRK